MKQPGKAAVRLFWALALLAALCTGQVPGAGGKSMVRAVLLTQEEGLFHIALLAQAPAKAANSADAEEQLALCWGEGESLAQAYAEAEAQLAGTPDYALCDTVLAGGAAPLAALRAQAAFVEASGRGRLAARVLCWAGTAAQLRSAAEKDGTLCQRLFAAALREKQAPRLYALLAGCPAVPAADWNQSSILCGESAMLLTDTGGVCLSGQAAALLRAVQRGAGQVTWTAGEHAYSLRLIASPRALSPDAAALRLDVFADGLPADADARAAAMDRIAAALRENVGRFYRLGRQQGRDLLGLCPVLGLRYGARAAAQPALFLQIALHRGNLQI